VTRPRPLRLWAVALWALCVVAATGSVARNQAPAFSPGTAHATVATSAAGSDPAVLPAKVVDEVGSPAHTTPLRMPLMAAVVAGLAGVAAVVRSRGSTEDSRHRPLRARRHTIAVRAPPLQFV
jgi:hypothetical protein